MASGTAGPSILLKFLADVSGVKSAVEGATSSTRSAGDRMHEAFSGAVAAINKTGVLGPFGDALAGIDQGIDDIKNKASELGPKMMGVGTTAMGVGLVLQERRLEREGGKPAAPSGDREHRAQLRPIRGQGRLGGQEARSLRAQCGRDEGRAAIADPSDERSGEGLAVSRHRVGPRRGEARVAGPSGRDSRQGLQRQRQGAARIRPARRDVGRIPTSAQDGDERSGESRRSGGQVHTERGGHPSPVRGQDDTHHRRTAAAPTRQRSRSPKRRPRRPTRTRS